MSVLVTSFINRAIEFGWYSALLCVVLLKGSKHQTVSRRGSLKRDLGVNLAHLLLLLIRTAISDSDIYEVCGFVSKKLILSNTCMT